MSPVTAEMWVKRCHDRYASRSLNASQAALMTGIIGIILATLLILPGSNLHCSLCN